MAISGTLYGIATCSSKPANDVATSQQAAAAAASAKQSTELSVCRREAAARRQEYDALTAAHRYREAMSVLRQCADLLDDKELQHLADTADAKDRVITARDRKAPPRDRETAISVLERDYPNELVAINGKQLRAEIDRDVRALARNEAAADAARRKKEGVSIGMSQSDVIASSWGKPKRVNRTTYAWGVHEQWVYGGGYLYFEDGRLTSIQTTN